MVFAGPFPPPTHGQSVCTQMLAEKLAGHGVPTRHVNLSGQTQGTIGKIADKFGSHFEVIRNGLGAPVTYISANSNRGMWLTAAAALPLRLAGKRLFIHHHAFDHVRRRRASMVALARAAGPEAVHIVLGQTMGDQLRLHTPEVKNTFVLNNAGLVDPGLRSLAGRAGKDGIRLGHLSNLSREKGIRDVIRLAQKLFSQENLSKLILAGPATDAESATAVREAEDILGDRFVYLGPVRGKEKEDFFSEISHFVFPTRYKNEASPMVLLEAMVAGVPCVSIDIGCIKDDLGLSGGIAIDLSDDFVERAAEFIATAQLGPNDARQQFDRLLGAHETQVKDLVSLAATAHR